MWKNVIVTAAATVVVLGAGGAALAASSPSPSPTPSASATGHPAAKARGNRLGAALGGRLRLARVEHAQWVTAGAGAATGSFVTHDAIRGQVTAVGSGSLTVKAADNTSETYLVTSSTKIRIRTGGKGQAGSISEVKVGERVGVLGTGSGTGPYTATAVVAVAP
jgi:hypothetical protein